MKKNVTSQDVAKAANVSRTTVSLVLNNVESARISEATREKVRLAAIKLAYIPNVAAQALASQRSQAIGLVMTRSPHHISSDTFLPKILGGLLQVIQKHNFRLLIETVDEENEDRIYLELARAKHIDGMILLTPRIGDKGLKKLEEVDIPTVLMGSLADSTLYSVDVDNRAAARKAVQYLVELGHAEIACISNAPPTYSAATDRILGYQDALQAANIMPNEALIRYADFDPASGYEAMQSLIHDRQKFSAVFVASDNVMIGAQSALRETGYQIPDDVSVIGFDDIPSSVYANPPLTTIRLPAQKLASEACLLLLDLLDGKQPARRRRILETELIVRQSCRKM